MSVQVGHFAFFSLAADLSPLHNKMFTTKTMCINKFLDIFKEISIPKIHLLKVHYRN